MVVKRQVQVVIDGSRRESGSWIRSFASRILVGSSLHRLKNLPETDSKRDKRRGKPKRARGSPDLPNELSSPSTPQICFMDCGDPLRLGSFGHRTHVAFLRDICPFASRLIHLNTCAICTFILPAVWSGEACESVSTGVQDHLAIMGKMTRNPLRRPLLRGGRASWLGRTPARHGVRDASN